MSLSRYVTVEWVGLQDRHGSSRMVVRDPAGREATFPKPSSSQAVDSIVNLIKSLGAKLVKVEVRSGLSLSDGGRLYLKRWFRNRQIDVHVSLAISLSERFRTPLLIDDRVFLLEAFEATETMSEPGDPERTIQ